MKFIQGTIDDGNAEPGTIPWANTLYLVIGEKNTIRLKVKYTSGRKVTLTGHTLVLTVKDGTAANFSRLALTGTLRPDEGVNVVDFDVTAAGTQNIPPGRYVYDVWITAGTLSRVQVVPLHAAFFAPAAGIL